MTKNMLRVAVLAAALLGGFGQASAGQTAFTDKSSFIASAGPLAFESFENPISFTSAPPGGLSNLIEATFADVTVTCAQPSCVFSYDNAGNYFPTDGVAAVGAYGQQGITFTFARPVKAFGIDTIGAGTAGIPTDIAFTTADGTATILSSIFQSSFANVLFGGMTDTKGFTSLTIYGSDGADFVAYDSLMFSAGVPEPRSWLLMIVGLGCVGGAIRRFRLGRALAA